MIAWSIPKEVSDWLTQAGYVAVPKEDIKRVYAQQTVSVLEHHHHGAEPSFKPRVVSNDPR